MRYNQMFLLLVLVVFQVSSLCSIGFQSGHNVPRLELLQDESKYQNIVFIADHVESLPEDSQILRFDAMMQAPVVNRPMSKRECRAIVAYIQASDYQCRQNFRMGLNEFNNIMWLGYEEFIDKVFNQLYLSDEVIRQLWHIYLSSSLCKRPSKVEKYGKVVEEKIAQRINTEQAKQKAEQESTDRHNKTIAIEQEAARIKAAEQRLFDEQKACEKNVQQEECAKLEEEVQDQQKTLIFYEQIVKNQYQSCDFDPSDCPDRELEKQWIERKEALEKTHEQDYTQYDQAFNLTPQTVGFLAAHDIDYNFQGFFGTALQQQLHGEMCDVLSQAATMHQQFPYHNNLLTSVVDFADAAYDANKSEQILLASQLMDVDWIVLRLSREIATAAIPYAKAVVSGVVHSATDSFHILADPISTFHGLGKAIYFVIETAALNSSEMVLEYPAIYEPMRDKRNTEITLALQSLGNQMANSTGPQKVEALTRFGTDLVIPGKIIHAVGGVCGVIRSQAKIMRTLEGIAPMLADELGFEKATQELILATEKLEVAAHEGVAKNVAKELMESKALHSEMRSFDKAKNAVKSEGPTIGLLKEYPNGKYVNNPKHHMNSRKGIGKPPCDGQKALDKSALVQTDPRGLNDRVGIENGKVVKFHEHQPGEFHGYIVEDVHGMDDAYRNALYKAGLIRSVKSCKVIK